MLELPPRAEWVSEGTAVAIRLVIFDCDGVLFHSDRANVAFYNAVLREAGEPPLEPDAEIAAHALASSELYKKLSLIHI